MRPDACTPRAAPVKIFGDLHGQFSDLMRLFEEYGTPSTSGDITYIDYLVRGRGGVRGWNGVAHCTGVHLPQRH